MGSGWMLEEIIELVVSNNKYSSSRGSSYFSLPKLIQDKKAVINIKNKDEMCFKYSVLC